MAIEVQALGATDGIVLMVRAEPSFPTTAQDDTNAAQQDLGG